MADLRFAAWFSWMTPLLTALSSFLVAFASDFSAAALSPAAMASRVRRTSVRSSLLTALLRSLAFSLVLLRLICDLMFATCRRLSFEGESDLCAGQRERGASRRS